MEQPKPCDSRYTQDVDDIVLRLYVIGEVNTDQKDNEAAKNIFQTLMKKNTSPHEMANILAYKYGIDHSLLATLIDEYPEYFFSLYDYELRTILFSAFEVGILAKVEELNGIDVNCKEKILSKREDIQSLTKLQSDIFSTETDANQHEPLWTNL